MEFYKQQLNNLQGFCIYLGTWILILRLSSEQLGLLEVPVSGSDVSYVSWRMKLKTEDKFTRGSY